ncbi:hypothetical protein [Dyadobacter sp. CY312]|uniref:hypothetical protein n=1 Tax=Dyadobacter sp. CY312 TaxID=2907303 RepID=UPI001F41ABAB|nr:hypothetical protein [Dyadobacter sp. CY312]MCE7044535.1 hypothetical protein [Dyadobacter sp. CY312]
MNPEYFDFGKIIHSIPNFRIVFYHQLTAGMLRDHNRLVFAHINRQADTLFRKWRINDNGITPIKVIITGLHSA